VDEKRACFYVDASHLAYAGSRLGSRAWPERRSAGFSCCDRLFAELIRALPAAIGYIAYQNKAAIYDLLFAASAETMLTIAADKKHLGARIGTTSVLHTCIDRKIGSPHDKKRAVSSRLSVIAFISPW
jgi:hypothetical protein